MPRHVRFPREAESGIVPEGLEPGSPGFNFADGKMYVGGPGGSSILVGFPLRSWRSTNTYYFDDTVCHQGYLWRAKVSVVPPGAFSLSQWERMGPADLDETREFVGTVAVQASSISEDDDGILISAGSGYILAPSTPSGPGVQKVSWPQRRISKSTLQRNRMIYVGVNAGGSVGMFFADEITEEWRRAHILLGHFVLSAGEGSLIDPVERSIPAHATRSDVFEFLEMIGSFRIAGAHPFISATNTIGVEPGVVWSFHGKFSGSEGNVHEVPATVPLSVRMAMRQGLASDAVSTEIDPSAYDNAGVEIPVPSDQVTIQYVFLKPDGGAVVQRGQKLYSDTATAASKVVEDVSSFVFSDVIAKEYVLLGALVTTGDGSEQIMVPSEMGVAGSRISGPGGGLQGISFLPMDGSQSMTGDLDLGGNRVTNGEIDGTTVDLMVRVFTQTGEVSSTSGELAVNTEDRKVLVGGTTVADRTEDFSDSRIYAMGDLAIRDQTFHRCTAPSTGPGPFVPTDWEQVGASPLDPATGVLLTNPPDATRNTVDLVAQGGFSTALSVTADDAQAVNIADFGPRAWIDRAGVPGGTFQGDIQAVTQVGHGLSGVGLALYQRPDGLFVRADISSPGTHPTCVLREVIDANRILVQYTGIVPNLDPAVFAGGVAPTRNTLYRAASDNGTLSALSNGPPVMMALGPTTGVLRFGFQVEVETLQIEQVYPVGSVYLTMAPTLPDILTTTMTWERIAHGRAIVGVGDNGQRSWALGQQFGQDAHQLSISEIPSHDHTIDPPPVSGQTTVTPLRGNIGFRTGVWSASGVFYPGPSTGLNRSFLDTGDSSSANFLADHNHGFTVDIPPFPSLPRGGSASHNNVQPSFALMVWQRTA